MKSWVHPHSDPAEVPAHSIILCPGDSLQLRSVPLRARKALPVSQQRGRSRATTGASGREGDFRRRPPGPSPAPGPSPSSFALLRGRGAVRGPSAALQRSPPQPEPRGPHLQEPLSQAGLWSGNFQPFRCLRRFYSRRWGRCTGAPAGRCLRPPIHPRPLSGARELGQGDPPRLSGAPGRPGEATGGSSGGEGKGRRRRARKGWAPPVPPPKPACPRRVPLPPPSSPSPTWTLMLRGRGRLLRAGCRLPPASGDHFPAAWPQGLARPGQESGDQRRPREQKGEKVCHRLGGAGEGNAKPDRK